MADDTRFPGCRDDLTELSPELCSLYHELLADGTVWRTEQPAMSGLDATIVALMIQREAARHPDTATASPARAPGSQVRHTDMKGTLPMQGKRLRGLVAAAATLAVVALFATALLNTALHRSSPRSPGATTTAASPTDAHGRWVKQPRLTEPGASSDPAIAPTDPSVVYEATNPANAPNASGDSSGITLRTTADGGASWRTISIPGGIIATDLKDAVFFVSPLRAQTVFLQLFDESMPNCPPGSSVSEGSPMCIPVYVSTNSGASWLPVHLPVPGVLGYGGVVGSAPLYAQGTRLYSSATCYGDAACTRILASDDGGLTWQPVDGAIRAGGQSVCDYAVSPAGSTIFAVTASDHCAQQGHSPMLLWRSDDAGGHWAQVGALPQPFVHGMAVTANPAGGTPLLYINMPRQIGTFSKGDVSYAKLSASPGDLRVSADGGLTWHAAPPQGAPTNQDMSFGPYGALSDGSVVFPFVPAPDVLTDPAGVPLYTWKLGDTSWHELAPALPTTTSYIDTLTITADPGQGATLWAVTGDYTVYVFRP